MLRLLFSSILVLVFTGFTYAQDQPISSEPIVPFQNLEQMPRFPGCEELDGDYNAKKACADQKLLQFISANIQYPDLARENNVQGMAVISFVVTPNGQITTVNILRDPGSGTGAEAKRVIESMRELPEAWTPGYVNEKAVHVRLNIPVHFKLTEPVPPIEAKEEEIEDD